MKVIIKNDRSKKNRYKCPECGSGVIWFHNNLKAGSACEIKCENNPASSRVDWDPKTDTMCFWKGTAIRKRSGEIGLFHKCGKVELRYRKDHKGR